MAQPEIKITTQDDGADFLFVSYKSQNRAQMEEIVATLQQRYGLRVYYDKKFEVENLSWIKLMPQQLSSEYCKGMLVFGSSQYICSYACLMELLYFKTVDTLDLEERPKPIIPIVLDPVKQQIQVLDPDKDLLSPVPMLATEADFMRKKIIDSIKRSPEHLEEDEELSEKIDQFIKLLDKIENRLNNDGNTTNTNRVKPAFIAKCIKEFFGLQGENSNYFTKNDAFYEKLYHTITNPKVCGPGVFEAPGAVRTPPAPAGASPDPVPPVKRGPGRPRKTEARPAAATPVQDVEAPAPTGKEAPHSVSAEPPAEVPLPRFAGAVRPDTTVGQFRALAADPAFCQVLGRLRRDGSLFPRQRGIFDYAMLAVLGGCNAMGHPYQQNYYDCAVANAERKLEGVKRTADWTWSSNARKVVGLEKSGRLDAPYNAPFEVLPEGTTLSQLQAAFRAGASTEYRTRDNEAVARVFDVLYRELG